MLNVNPSIDILSSTWIVDYLKCLFMYVLKEIYMKPVVQVLFKSSICGDDIYYTVICW